MTSKDFDFGDFAFGTLFAIAIIAFVVFSFRTCDRDSRVTCWKATQKEECWK